ncbi:MAG: hypothetical protein CBB87_10440 [Micavibrio sp. TMED27]|nr:hypothetical protein [Micavibrio sp.]OUT90171.1 MAG: hypothetical protein CBB87_10440 [Micavibrio sp. TMED27]|tara:strand:- start:3563 stop:3877 length:315 start_codon:yes stop_codon:yes gene_type:complete
MTDKDKFRLTDEWASSQVLPVVNPPKCDIEKYREHVQEFELTAEEEAELIKNLWLIMAAFVDLGFGVDSIQLLSASDEKPGLAPVSKVDGQDKRLKPNGGIHDD